MEVAKPVWVDIRGAAAPFAVGAICVLGLGAAHGGYFPTAWGWAIVAFVAVLAWPLTVGVARRSTPHGGVLLGALLGFSCWFALSAIWGTASAAIDETVRVLVYVAGAAVALAIVRRATFPALLAGVLTGATVLACYALATRLFPDRIGTFDSVAVYRLSTPIGYWNALGLLCALATLLALGLAASAGSPVRAAFAAAPVPILLTALYFTFSRGSWIALGIGLAVAVALDPRRIRLTASVFATGVPAGLAVLAASRSGPLTHLQSTVALAAHDGHRLALLLVAFVVAAAAFTGALLLLGKGAAVDWDWQITSVTLAAIFVGVALLAAARPEDEREASPVLRYSALGVALAVGVVGFVFLVGNMFLSRASTAASEGKWATAAHDARRASSWLPWSTQPWTQLGEAQLARGQVAAAQVSFRKAIAKDNGDWNLRFDLARATAGKTQRAALAQATKLDPLSPELTAFRSDLDSQAGISITAGAKP